METAIKNAILYFGDIEEKPTLNFAFDNKEMNRTDNNVKIGTLTIPKGSNPPKRIIIDTDPNYPLVLVRIIEK